MYTGIDMNEDFSDFNGYLIKVQDLKCVKAPVKVSSVLPSGLKRNEYRITFEYDDYMTLNEVRILSDSQTENREMERCVETEPGHVAVMKATEEGEDFRIYTHTIGPF